MPIISPQPAESQWGTPETSMTNRVTPESRYAPISSRSESSVGSKTILPENLRVATPSFVFEVNCTPDKLFRCQCALDRADHFFRQWLDRRLEAADHFAIAPN